MSAHELPVAIEVAEVSKHFRKHSEPAKTLKERLLTMRHSTVEDFAALDDVDFNVLKGETFGILGHNGSGKSTLLKCIAGTIRPSEGIVRVRGRLSALLELGAGFHPDLTGRDNVYLNGSILGFSRARVDEIFDDIVEFAELSDFIDTQVKHYSSGMYARLGFAVAVNLEPDVLLIDEVLAVGDEAFQAKCIDRVRGFQRAGRTICLVTHAADQVLDLCDRALVLDHGKMIHLGDVEEAVKIYRRSLADRPESAADFDLDEPTEQAPGEDSLSPVEQLETRPSPIQVTSGVIDPPQRGATAFEPGDDLRIIITCRAPEPTAVNARFVIHRQDGVPLLDVSTNLLFDKSLVALPNGTETTLLIKKQPFIRGRYQVTIVLEDPSGATEYHLLAGPDLAFEVQSEDTYGAVQLDMTASVKAIDRARAAS